MSSLIKQKGSDDTLYDLGLLVPLWFTGQDISFQANTSPWAIR